MKSTMVAGLASGLIVAGCDGFRAQDIARTTVRDSAEIKIVEHKRIPAYLPAWTVAVEPELVIGSLEGDGPDVFGRIESVNFRGDGVIVVADGVNLELRAFDRFGRHLDARRRGAAESKLGREADISAFYERRTDARRAASSSGHRAGTSALRRNP